MTDAQFESGMVTLAECPPGLFQTEHGLLGFKTEYAHKSEQDGRWYPEAYVVESGEFFWGGVKTHPLRAALMVRPVDAETLATALLKVGTNPATEEEE